MFMARELAPKISYNIFNWYLVFYNKAGCWLGYIILSLCLLKFLVESHGTGERLWYCKVFYCVYSKGSHRFRFFWHTLPFLGLKIAKIFPHNPSFQQCRHLCSLGLFCLGIFFGNAVAGVLGNIFCCYFVFFPHTPNFQVFAPAIAQTLHIELLLLSS